MWADISEQLQPSLRDALACLGTELIDHVWAMDVDHCRFRIGSDVLSVFEDTCSVDVEGTPELVQRFLTVLQESCAKRAHRGCD
jgi:hypothetical protein